MLRRRILLFAALVLAAAPIAPGCSPGPTQARRVEDPAASADESNPPPAGGLLPTAVSESEIRELVAGNNAFACDLYGRLRDGEGNLFLSPYSISAALAMTYAGARGATAEEMRAVLHFPSSPGSVHATFCTLAAVLPPKEGTLAIANRLWGRKDCTFLEPFLDITRRLYGAELERLDFAGAAEEARETINAWVERKTERKIRELVKRGILAGPTMLVLTNAIYFKGSWANRFDPELTLERPFTRHDGSPVNCSLMSQTGEFVHACHQDLQALELPYAGKEYSMIVLLPRTHDGLPAIEKRLSPGSLSAWLGTGALQPVRISLPRFTATRSLSLAGTLGEMGMPSAFEPGAADFSGMTGGLGPFISAVVHKAFVDVNEEGTEAAAATGVVMKVSVPPAFVADRPFLFLIRDNRTGTILFMGRLLDPTA